MHIFPQDINDEISIAMAKYNSFCYLTTASGLFVLFFFAFRRGSRSRELFPHTEALLPTNPSFLSREVGASQLTHAACASPSCTHSAVSMPVTRVFEGYLMKQDRCLPSEMWVCLNWIQYYIRLGKFGINEAGLKAKEPVFNLLVHLRRKYMIFFKLSFYYF